MWNSFRSMSQPWKWIPGWESDLLSSLPSDVAKRLYALAFRRANSEMMSTWQWWLVLAMFLGLTGVSVALIWVVAANLGFGPLGRFALEVGFHVTLGLVILDPLVQYQKQFMLPFVRAALADEVLRFVRDEKLDSQQTEKRDSRIE